MEAAHRSISAEGSNIGLYDDVQRIHRELQYVEEIEQRVATLEDMQRFDQL